MRWRLLQSDWLCQDSGRSNRNLARVPRPFLLFPFPFRPSTNHRAPWRVWLLETTFFHGVTLQFQVILADAICEPYVSYHLQQLHGTVSLFQRQIFISDAAMTVSPSKHTLAHALPCRFEWCFHRHYSMFFMYIPCVKTWNSCFSPNIWKMGGGGGYGRWL